MNITNKMAKNRIANKIKRLSFNFFFFAFFFLISSTGSSLFANDLVEFGKVEFVLCSQEKGKEILTREDLYFSNLSEFDLSAKSRTSEKVSLSEFKDFVGKQVIEWNEEEEARIKRIIEEIRPMIGIYSILFPDDIFLIKTTGIEEGEAAYCRGMETIVIPQKMLIKTDEELRDLIIHELFHIFSRNNPELREDLYRILGFEQVRKLEIPEEIIRWTLTNPDTVEYDSYFTTTVRGVDLKLMPVLLALSPYDEKKGGFFFDYLQLGFIAIEITEDKTIPFQMDNRYLILPPNIVPRYFELMGENTDYIIHPEEVLAENFVLVIKKIKDVPTPRILEEMEKIFNR